MNKSDHPLTNRIPTSYLAIALAIFIIGGSSGIALGTHQNSSPTYTGCLGSKSGQLYALNQGDQPLRPCHKGDSLVHLSGGDITAVKAGDGLSSTNGEESGDVSLSVNSSQLDERYQNEGEPPVHHDHNDSYVNYGEFQAVSPTMLEYGYYYGLDSDRVDGHEASDFLTEPTVTDYEIVRSETEYPGDERFDIVVQRAYCSPNKVVLGGGGFIDVRSKHIDTMRPIYPELDPGTSYGWSTSFRINEKIGWNFTVTTYAICVEIEEDP